MLEIRRIVTSIHSRLSELLFRNRTFLARIVARIRQEVSHSHYSGDELRQIQDQLKDIVSQYPLVDKVLVFPPSLDWHTQLFQRPQQLALAFARQSGLVFYLQPGELKLRRSLPKEPFLKVTERLFLCNLPLATFVSCCFPILTELPFRKDPVFYVLTWNWRALGSLENHPSASIRFIYDYVDEIEAFPGNRLQVALDHEQLVRKATLVVTTAERLYQQVLPTRPDALLCPNGVDIDHFIKVRAQGTPLPDDLIPILKIGKPIIGYYGALARWFDYDLLKAVAQKRPDLSFVLIGPDYDHSISPSGLLRIENVYWLGVKPYDLIPDYLHYFDVATIPFQLNEITHSTSPLKLFEYLAGAKPVVITAMHESMRYEGILVADGVTAQQRCDNFSEKLDQALRLRFDAGYISQIEEIARQNTWDVRARQILDALD